MAHQDLHRHLALQATVGRLVDGAHAAFPEDALQPVATLEVSLDRQGEPQLGAVFGTDRIRLIEAGTTERALLDEVHPLAVEVRQHVPALPRIAVGALAEPDVLADHRHLAGDGDEQAHVLGRVGLLGPLPSQKEEAGEAQVRSQHRNHQLNAEAGEPFALAGR